MDILQEIAVKIILEEDILIKGNLTFNIINIEEAEAEVET